MRSLKLLPIIIYVGLLLVTGCMANSNESMPPAHQTYQPSDVPEDQLTVVLDWTNKAFPRVAKIDEQTINPRFRRAKLKPGMHRIILSNVVTGRGNNIEPRQFAEYPISVDTIGGRTYLLKQAWDDAGWGFEISNIWIEDEVTGEIVAGRSSLSKRLSKEAIYITQWQSLCRNAISGDGEARSSIGAHYRHGWKPVNKSLMQAYKWFQLAIDVNYLPANGYKSAIEKEMTPEQLKQAEELVADWIPDELACITEAAFGP